MTNSSSFNEAGYVQGPLKWAIAFSAALGAILEVIDTSIVNVALTSMQASLGATVSEIGWVVTGYAIANVVLIPLSAWLGDYFGKKTYFIFSLIGFTIASVVMIMLGKLSTKIDARLLIAIGGVGTAFVMFDLSKLTVQTGTDDLFWPLVWRGAFTVLMFLPLSLATLGPLPKQDVSAGSGFYNLTRQLGGSVGIAILTTLLDKREAFHRAILSTNLSPYDFETNQRLSMLSRKSK